MRWSREFEISGCQGLGGLMLEENISKWSHCVTECSYIEITS